MSFATPTKRRGFIAKVHQEGYESRHVSDCLNYLALKPTKLLTTLALYMYVLYSTVCDIDLDFKNGMLYSSMLLQPNNEDSVATAVFSNSVYYCATAHASRAV